MYTCESILINGKTFYFLLSYTAKTKEPTQIIIYHKMQRVSEVLVCDMLVIIYPEPKESLYRL